MKQVNGVTGRRALSRSTSEMQTNRINFLTGALPRYMIKLYVYYHPST